MEVFRESRTWTSNFEVIGASDFPFNRSFPCSACKKSTFEKELFQGKGQNYCWPCFQEKFSRKCAACSKSITGFGKMTFIFYNGQVWHAECFSCRVCGKPLGMQRELIQEKRSVYCKHCGEGAVFRFG